MGLKNFRILILKIPKLSAFKMAGSSLFHSIIADGKKLFLKKLCLILIRGVQSEEDVRRHPFSKISWW